MTDKKEIQHAYFLLNGFIDGLERDDTERNYLLELQEWFLEQLKKSEQPQTLEVKPVWDGDFHNIKCLESETQFGFFKDETDIRPSSCTWIDKDAAEKVNEIIIKEMIKGVKQFNGFRRKI